MHIVRLIVLTLVAGAYVAAQDGKMSAGASLDAIRHEKPANECLERRAEDFVAKTRSERVAEAVRSVASPTPFVYTAIRAGIGQASNRPKEWGQRVEGYSLRYGSIYAEHFISQTFQQAVAYKFHEDNQYFVSGDRNIARRFGYAISSALLARHDDGSRSISVSAIGGAATAAFVSRTWQPRSTTTLGDGAVSFGLTMGTRMAINVMREFSPRFLGRLLP